MSMTDPNGAAEAIDLMPVLTRMQDQLDDLAAAVEAQQRTIDEQQRRIDELMRGRHFETTVASPRRP